MIALVSAASAGPLATARDPWPTLPVEQPVVAPRGWTLVDASFVDEGDGGEQLASMGVRYGFSHRVELFVEDEVRLGGGPEPETPVRAPSLGARASIGRARSPARSAGLLLRVDCPWVEDAGGLALGLEGETELGPFRLSGALTGTWTAPDRGDGPSELAVARVGALLEVGPLAPGAFVEGVVRGGSVVDGTPVAGATGLNWAFTGIVQLSRAFALDGLVGYTTDLAEREPFPDARLGVRLAL